MTMIMDDADKRIVMTSVRSVSSSRRNDAAALMLRPPQN